MKVTVFSTHEFDRPYLQQAAGDKHELVFQTVKLNTNTAETARGSGAVAVFTSDTLSAPVLEQLHAIGVKYIALRSAGYDHVDIPTAKQLGMKVANVPGYSPYSIAEHAVALLMAVTRRIVQGQKLMDLNDYRLDRLTSFDMHGKTVGVIGTGKIGAGFARIMRGFGCRLLGYDPEHNEQLVTGTGLQYVSLEEMYRQSDIISIHCPLNKATDYLLTTASFGQMKKGVTIINTARGKIIDTQALIEALDNGTVAYAGLDVYEREKSFFFEDLQGQRNTDDLFIKLRSYPNVLITGHQAFLTREAIGAIADITIANIDDWAAGRPSANEL